MQKSSKVHQDDDKNNSEVQIIGFSKNTNTNEQSASKQSYIARLGSADNNQRSNLPKNFKSKLPTSATKSKSLKTLPTSSSMDSQASNKGDKISTPAASSTDNSKTRSSIKIQNQETKEPAVQSKGSKKDLSKHKNKHEDSSEKEPKTQNEAVTSNVNGSNNECEIISEQPQQKTTEENSTKDNNDDEVNLIETQDNTDNQLTTECKDELKKNSNGYEISDDTNNKLQEDQSVTAVNKNIETVETERSAVSISTNTESLPSNDNQSQLDTVESTTSESVPTEKEQPNKFEDNFQAKEDDVSFISYNSTIMLKDVQIKLNDCLKDNSKLMDVTDPNASMSESFRDLSFGCTLRKISGRNSIGRLKHVTLRQRQMSPNDSLFVNTSNVSFSHDRSTFMSELSDSPDPNSSRLNRKRKLTENDHSVKKFKTDQNYSILNTSLEYLKNLRKPIQVSTPKAQGYKFEYDKKPNNSDSTTDIAEEAIETKKWCLIM
ncbi:GSCOCG00008579001-RA-CDS [Cotesia congregata]|uniref:Uncharacterized protein n=1 Tax=Cotesia congregata TaxID=51543 RepID=A0A8J2H2S6_COTCN|nr:GSCOCG00008579001-RA-CDS [Cotesia congregata]CAG5075491.1 Protein of unknown function [Cotesia congregata]